MRKFGLVLAIICGLVLCFSLCVLADEEEIPDLVGTWEASFAASHSPERGFDEMERGEEPAYGRRFVVEEQRGRVFAGVHIWVNEAGVTRYQTTSGVIAMDNEWFFIEDHCGEFWADGLLLGPDQLVLHFTSVNPVSVGYVIFERVVD